MRILCETQRTPEWFAAKKGRISASSAYLCLSGKATKSRRNYVDCIADDLQGIPDFDDEDPKPWFTDGIYYESFARGWYQFKTNRDTVQTGFVVHDEYDWIGCSPDDLVGDDGLAEYKFRKSLHTFDEHSKCTLARAVKAQIHTQLFVCDRQWCDYTNYWRDDANGFEKGHIQRIYRDQSYIDNTLLPAFVSFWKDVQAEIARRKLMPRVPAL